MISQEEIAELRSLHEPMDPLQPKYCDLDTYPWPCPTIRALDALEGTRADFQVQYDALSTSFARFRQAVRGAILPFQSSNPATPDQEIVDAIKAVVTAASAISEERND